MFASVARRAALKLNFLVYILACCYTLDQAVVSVRLDHVVQVLSEGHQGLRVVLGTDLERCYLEGVLEAHSGAQGSEDSVEHLIVQKMQDSALNGEARLGEDSQRVPHLGSLA